MNTPHYADQIAAAAQIGPGPARLMWRAGEWHRLAPLVQGWAVRGIPGTLGLSGDDVDDLVARVLVRAWTAKEVPDDPAAWCSIVARRMALDTLKRAKMVPLEDAPEVEAPEAFDDLTYRQQVARLRQALRRLDDSVRRAVVLRYLHGKLHPEIAQTLGITIGASKMRVSRGLRLLRAIYERTPVPPLNDRGLPEKPRGRPPAPISWRDLIHPQAPALRRLFPYD